MLQSEIGKRKAEIEAQLKALKLQEAEAMGKLADGVGAPVGNKNAQGGGDNGDNINIVRGGTSLTYTYRRLLRDRPDLAEQVKAGTMSSNKAAIEAGFRNPPPTPFEQVRKLLPKLAECRATWCTLRPTITSRWAWRSTAPCSWAARSRCIDGNLARILARCSAPRGAAGAAGRLNEPLGARMSWLYDAIGTVPWASLLTGCATGIGSTIAVYTFFSNRNRDRKADIRAAFVKMGARSWYFRISNVGRAAARDVRAEFLGGPGVIIESEIRDKLPIAMLEAGDRMDLIAAPDQQSARKQTVKLVWADGASKRNEKTLDVQLF